MREIQISIHSCGMSEETYTPKVMIYAPHNTEVVRFTQQQCREASIVTLRDLTEELKRQRGESEESHLVQQLCPEHLYIQTPDCLLGFQRDFSLSELFDYFHTQRLELVCFFVGGASLHCMGYRFTVHPREQIHQNSPHVHVEQDDQSVRYSLENFTPMDNVPRTFRRDEKKIILPFLKRNQARLLGYWNHYLNGFLPPSEDEAGRQYYPES